MDADGPDDSGLEVSLTDILKAFELAGAHYSTKGNADTRLEARWQVALGIIDRALMESDRGLKLLELTAAMAIKPHGGTFYIGPFEV